MVAHDGTSSQAQALSATTEERVAVASNWTLVWWRFRRHYIALFSAFVLAGLYLVVLCPDFFSTQNPELTDARQAFIPVQPLHFFDGARFSPWVPGIAGKRNPVTLRMEWTRDPNRKIPVQFFAQSAPYRILGVFETNVHLLGPADPGQRIFLLGSDRLGRDQWSRIMHGTQTSMTVGLVAVGLSVVLGVALGGISGYFGGWVDTLIMRSTELLLSIPGLYLIVALRGVFPLELPSQQTYLAIVAILSFIGWATLARVIRGMVLSIRQAEFVLAAEAMGASSLRIIVRHVLPNTMSFTIVAATVAVPGYILGEVFLSFLGVGVQPPAASWGNMLNAARSERVLTSFPWMLLAPGVAIFLTVMAFNFFGDGLRDALDPRKTPAAGGRS